MRNGRWLFVENSVSLKTPIPGGCQDGWARSQNRGPSDLCKVFVSCVSVLFYQNSCLIWSCTHSGSVTLWRAVLSFFFPFDPSPKQLKHSNISSWLKIWQGSSQHMLSNSGISCSPVRSCCCCCCCCKCMSGPSEMKCLGPQTQAAMPAQWGKKRKKKKTNRSGRQAGGWVVGFNLTLTKLKKVNKADFFF